MKSNYTEIIRELLPPFTVRAGKYFSNLLSTNGSKTPAVHNRLSKEQVASWYDESFAQNEHWRQHYTSSRYYFMWSVLVDRLLQRNVKRVLDIGCGPGQFASLARDRGIGTYWGLDFSPKRIEQARKACPNFDYFVEDAFVTDKFETLDYDAVVMTEVLEHVEGDVELIQRIRSGTYFLGSVPNFPFESHVRHFRTCECVNERYSPYFTDLRVDAFLSNDKGKTYFVLQGNVK